MDEKKQVMKKKKKMKRQFKNSDEIDKAEMKLKLDEEQEDIEDSGRGQRFTQSDDDDEYSDGD